VDGDEGYGEQLKVKDEEVNQNEPNNSSHPPPAEGLSWIVWFIPFATF